MKTCLTIAGSDSSGGAGIQADLKTFAANGVYGMSAITAVTAQNTLGITGIKQIPASFVAQQIDTVIADIRPDAIKIGMLANPEIINSVAESLSRAAIKNVVLDPVMAATTGSPLTQANAIEPLIAKLFPLASVVTPNIAELHLIAQALNQSASVPLIRDDLEQLGIEVYKALPERTDGKRTAVLVKGGHLDGGMSEDVLIDQYGCEWFSAERINNVNNHGTGCTLSSAIAANLAKGVSLSKSCREAKRYLQRTLQTGLNLGSGAGPLNHYPA